MKNNLAEKLTEEKNITDITNMDYIDSDTFKPTGQKIGNGCWGKVDLYLDRGFNKWAIKYFQPNETALKQMQERNWDAEKVMREESIPLDAASYNIVPRIIERDKTGKLFVAMPFFKEGDLTKNAYKMNTRNALEIGKDIATALKYYHSHKINFEEKDFWGKAIKGKAHGDVKPANILIANRRAYLSDLGSSTCITRSGNGGKRGQHGDINYRAPECDKEDATPSERADIWSLGAIIYELTTEEGIREGLDEINKKNLKRKLKKAPRKIRTFLKNCLAYSPYDRYCDGKNALENLEKTIERLDTRKEVWKHIKKWTLPIAIPTTFLALALYGINTHEPKKLNMPQTNTKAVSGILYKPGEEETKPLEFVGEAIDSLPEPCQMGAFSGGIIKNAKACTDNRNVAYLAKAYGQVVARLGCIAAPHYTDEQFKTYNQIVLNDERMHPYPSRYWAVVGKTIEHAITQSEIEKGKVDLEDAMAITRLGIEKVDQAKRISGSVDYKIYRNATGSDGKRIISEKEQDFIDHWLSQYYADID